MSDERPKRSWRDLDRNKDRSAHRRDEKPSGFSAARVQRSQKSYRSKLDQLFDSGKIGALVAKDPSTAATDPQADQRLKLLATVTKAEGRDSITKSIDGYLGQYDLPDNVDFLEKMLEHRDTDKQRLAVERLSILVDREPLKRAKSLVNQLKLIQAMDEDPELTTLAENLINKL